MGKIFSLEIESEPFFSDMVICLLGFSCGENKAADIIYFFTEDILEPYRENVNSTRWR